MLTKPIKIAVADDNTYVSFNNHYLKTSKLYNWTRQLTLIFILVYIMKFSMVEITKHRLKRTIDKSVESMRKEQVMT